MRIRKTLSLPLLIPPTSLCRHHCVPAGNTNRNFEPTEAATTRTQPSTGWTVLIGQYNNTTNGQEQNDSRRHQRCKRPTNTTQHNTIAPSRFSLSLPQTQPHNKHAHSTSPPHSCLTNSLTASITSTTNDPTTPNYPNDQHVPICRIHPIIVVHNGHCRPSCCCWHCLTTTVHTGHQGSTQTAAYHASIPTRKVS